MAINALDVFGEVEKASASKGSQYVNPGKHIFDIQKIILRPSDKDPSRLFFIVELETVSSSREDQPVGSTRSWIVDISRKQTGPSNVKGFAMALGPDIEEGDINKEDLAKLVADDQPARGIRVSCDAWEIETRAGNPFTKVKWEYWGKKLVTDFS
jgi:hypothetical protein